jgi:hypothetical protein
MFGNTSINSWLWDQSMRHRCIPRSETAIFQHEYNVIAIQQSPFYYPKISNSRRPLPTQLDWHINCAHNHWLLYPNPSKVSFQLSSIPAKTPCFMLPLSSFCSAKIPLGLQHSQLSQFLSLQPRFYHPSRTPNRKGQSSS